MAEYKKISARSQKSIIEYSEREELSQRPAVYVYPNSLSPRYGMDNEDLDAEIYLLLCRKDQMRVHIWEGGKFTPNEEVSHQILPKSNFFRVWKSS